jgi:hypothetical protein
LYRKPPPISISRHAYRVQRHYKRDTYIICVDTEPMYVLRNVAARVIIAVKFMVKYIFAYHKQLSINPFHKKKSL